jgi:hypothetical protein
MRRLILCAAAATAAGCATLDGSTPAGEAWTALGYLSPDPTSDPEIIGEFATKDACLEAVDWWMSRQVVGNPVSGECLPVDRR